MNVKRIFYFLLVLSLLVACEDKNRVVKPNDGPAHLRMIEQEYDFGNVDSYKDVLTHEFSFVNDGSEKLIITDVKNFCHCTHTEYPKEPIKSGHGGKITVTLDARDLTPGFFSRTIEISTNRNSVRIVVKGTKRQ